MNKNLRYLYFICLIATMGGLMFGFDIAIISGAVPFIQSHFNWNELQLGWGVSSLLVGAIIGAFGSGIFTDKYGRKKVLIFIVWGHLSWAMMSESANRYKYSRPCASFLTSPSNGLQKPDITGFM